MEISSGSISQASAPIEAQVALQRKASDQQAEVVSTIIDSATQTQARIAESGTKLLAVA